MKIELKRIHFSERLSEETNAFNADLYIDGKKAGDAYNHGQGGPTDYRSLSPEGGELIKKAEEFCLALPPKQETYGEESFTIEMNLENFIDNLLEEYLHQRELQRFRREIERKMIKSFVVGKPDQSYIPTTFKIPLEAIMQKPDGENNMVSLIQKYVVPKLKEGNILLNTNIPLSILKQAGLKEGQYMDPVKHEIKTAKKTKVQKGKKA